MSTTQKFELPQPILALVVLTLVLGSAATMMLGYPAAENIFFAVLIAVGFGISGYLKNTSPEAFDSVKFVITMIISVFAGLAMYELGYDYATAQNIVTNLFVNSGILVWLEYWLKIFVRRLPQ